MRSQGLTVAKHRIAAALKNADPEASSVRLKTMGRSLNPVPYSANGFGHKYHLDQNEKLIHYGMILLEIFKCSFKTSSSIYTYTNK